MANVTYDNSGQTTAGAVLSITLTAATFTITALANVLLVFTGYGVTGGSSTLINSVLINAATEIVANERTRIGDGNFETIAVHSQLNPVTGGNQSVKSSFSSSVGHCWIAVASIVGADVSGTPFGSSVTNSATGSITPETLGSVASVVGDLCIAAVASDANDELTPDGTQIQESLGVSADSSYACQYKTTASPTFQWTSTSVADPGWAIGGFAIKAPGSAVVVGQEVGRWFHPGRGVTNLARFFQSVKATNVATVVTVVFRKTLSNIGSHTGGRETHNTD